MPAVALGWRRCEQQKSRDPSQNRNKSKTEQDQTGFDRGNEQNRGRVTRWKPVDVDRAHKRTLVVGSWPQIQLMRQGQLAHDSHTFFFLSLHIVCSVR